MAIDKEDRYMNACIKYLKMNMRCVGYRDYVIKRLNKYQKIEEIVKFGNANELGFEYVGEKITEVIEDGNDD